MVGAAGGAGALGHWGSCGGRRGIWVTCTRSLLMPSGPAQAQSLKCPFWFRGIVAGSISVVTW